jgi:GH25 family lysozyme M1 (1,4-beta-N-acetylmuramidase)
MLKQTLFFFFLFFCLVVVLIKTQRKTTSRVRSHQDPWQMASDFDVRGLDLSHHNGKILYEGLDTLDFVFLKATEGTTHIDRDFETHYKGFKNKGIALGVYHFFRFDTDGKEQANHFLNRIKGHTFQVPLIVDVEHENNPRSGVKRSFNDLMSSCKPSKKRLAKNPLSIPTGMAIQILWKRNLMIIHCG